MLCKRGCDGRLRGIEGEGRRIEWEKRQGGRGKGANGGKGKRIIAEQGKKRGRGKTITRRARINRVRREGLGPR